MNACNFGGKYQSYHTNSERGYEQAINYYKQQKEAFLIKINKDKKIDDINKMGQNFTEVLNEEINRLFSQGEDNVQTKKMQQVFNDFEEKILTKLQGIKKNTTKKQFALSVLESYESERGRNSFNYSKTSVNTLMERGKEFLEQQLESIQVNQMFQEAFKEQFQKEAFFDLAQIQQAHGFARRILFNWFNPKSKQAELGIKQMQGYINAFVGLFKEDVLVMGLDNLADKLGIQGGTSVGADTNDSNLQTEIDISLTGKPNFSEINKINTLLLKEVEDFSKNETFTITIEPLKDITMQSKSWPSLEYLDKNPKLRPFFSIGNRANFVAIAKTPGKDDIYAWHYNVYALSRNVVPLLGATNLLYSTRDKVMWTHELISSFKERNYYLSFYFKRNKGTFQRPATHEVTWQQEVSADYFKGFKDNNS